MSLGEINDRGMVLLGCGKMGSALLGGWLESGLDRSAVHVIDPNPSEWLRGAGVSVNADLPSDPAVVMVAVKPQMMGDALPQIARFGGRADVMFISVAAGTQIAAFESAFGDGTPIVRAMPNTPAAIGRGITAIVGNDDASSDQLSTAEKLMKAVGQVVRLESEDQMDAVTGVSGSGPAYVFHLIETLAAAGEAEGLPRAMAVQLAQATVAGAGALAETAEEDAAQLRINVTSPNGTTQAALEVLMDAEQGFPALVPRAVRAAVERSRALSKED